MLEQKDIKILREIFSDYDYIMTTAQLNAEKLYYRDIQRMLDEGLIEKIKRGYYHWIEDYGNSEIVIINSLFPDAVLCMETALFYSYSHKSKRLFLRSLTLLHSRLDKAAKFMRKEDAQMSNCKVIALTNQKGGVGKTTTAVNLGVGLVQQGKKVLLIDADAQANLTMALGYNRPDDIPITLSTVMQNIIDDKSFDVSQGIIHHGEGVDLLPSNIELSGFEVRLINAMSRERVLKTYVNEVKKNYDYVLIDCMPSLGMITINALAAADSVIIPTQPHYLSAKGLELLLRSVSMVKRQINPKLRIDGILMTMVMPRTNISKEITATVKSDYGQKIKVFDTEIPHSIRAVEATAEGKSIFAYDKSGKVAAAYEQFGKEVVTKKA